MKLSEMKQLSDSALKVELEKLAEDQRNLRFQRANGPLDNPQLVRKNRKAIARIQTLLNERRGAVAATKGD